MKRASVRVTFPSVASAVLVLLLCSPRAEAQITVPSSTLPVAGDTLKVAIDDAPLSCGFVVATAPGGNQVWDLSCLRADRTEDVVYRPAAEGTAVSLFPGSTSVVKPVSYPRFQPAFLSPQEEYFTSSSTKVTYRGAYGMLPYFTGSSPARFNPPISTRRAPMNFFDINAESTGLLEPFDDTQMDPAIRQMLPFTADSFRYRVAVSRIDAVDAYGTVKLPGGDFEVLREKRTQYTETRIDAKVNPLGWLDVTDNFIRLVGASFLGVDTLVSYHFYNDVSKEPIAIVDVSNDFLSPLRATFKNVQPVCRNDGDPCGDQSSSACNMPDTCQAGMCVANLLAAGTACGSGANNACTSPDTCDGAGACVANDRANGTACSDGSACTTGDSCQNGACVAGPPPNCNDGNACTIDSCSPSTGCVAQPDPLCAPAISVVAAVQQVESCSPANGVLDPDERVTYAVTLRNNGAQPTTKLVATLLASPGVSAPSKAQNYGVIPAGGTATKSFTWTGVGACGAAWAASLALADNGQAVPGVTVTGSYGTPGGVCNTGCAVVRIATKTSLRRNTDGSVRATVTISNTGSVQANNVVLTSALLGTDKGTPLPQAVTTIPAGGSKTATVTFPASVLAGGNVLKLGGTYTGGTFSNSLRVTVP
jgi:hypothetical protein